MPAVPDPFFVETVMLDGMWRVPDDGTEHGRRYRIAWFDPPFRPPLEETTQALGICFTGERRIVLVTWNGEHWSLPGGSLEPGETLEQALAREVHEEACARITSARYIGCQRVEELDSDRRAPAHRPGEVAGGSSANVHRRSLQPAPWINARSSRVQRAANRLVRMPTG